MTPRYHSTHTHTLSFAPILQLRSAQFLTLQLMAATAWLVAVLLPHPAQARPLIADLSQYEIAIDTSFTGAKLILFGARQTAGDVVVVVRGPARDYMLRKKERRGGIWVNRRAMPLEDIPDYYAVAASKPLEAILDENMLNALGIGIWHLPYITEQTRKIDGLKSEELREAFREAFITHKTRKRLFNEDTHSITFMGDTLFKTTLPFPDTTPRGGYTAETYLIYNGQIVGVQSTPLFVAKQGMDAAIFQLAHEFPVIYGMLAILMALTAGWLSSVIFRKL